jgi:cytidine deaminase
MNHSKNELVIAARKVRDNAHAPFSEFKVGAAIETDDGEIVTGCNIESASFGLTVCAERVAVWKAISEGKRKIKAVAVVADTEDLTPQCGVCRQIIWEFGGDIPVTLANLHGSVETIQMKDLLPRAFDTKFLK